MTMNRKVVLARRPAGEPVEADFKLVEEPLPKPGKDQVLVDVEHLSIDAFIRTTLDGPQGLHGTMDLNTPVTALGVGRVRESGFAGLNQGDAVFGPMGAQTQVLLPGAALRKLDESQAPARTYLGAMGMTTGLTAYAGMLEKGQVQAGETVVVSAAAGAVGVVACQLAKIAGAKVVGIAGGKAKCRFLTDELGCDAAADYKAGGLGGKLKSLCPNGIDVFFDNVGGEVLDAALDNIATGARVVICGAISQYNDMSHVTGPSLYLRIPERNASMLGFTVNHFADKFASWETDLAGWIAAGKLKLPEHILEGIDSFPQAVVTLMTGGHTGKLLVAP